MWTSPYVLSCFVALTEKKLPFEVQTVKLHEAAQHSATYVHTSFTARVPALVDGDFSLSESSAIVEYLEDKWPAPGHAAVLPPELHQRARARQLMAWLRSDLGPIREERSSEYVFYPIESLPPFGPLSTAAHKAVTKLVTFAERVVPAEGGPLFGAWCRPMSPFRHGCLHSPSASGGAPPCSRSSTRFGPPIVQQSLSA